MKLKKVGVKSLAKFQAVLGGIMGTIGGIVGCITLLLGGQYLTAILVLIGIPLFYAVIMYIGGAIGAFFFNLAAKYSGGIEIEIEMGNQT